MNLEQLKKEWVDTPEYHKYIHELLCQLVNKDPVLNEHRTWVEQNVWGFGERSFWWLWKIICEELPTTIAPDEDKYKVFSNGIGVTSNTFRPSMLEVGVFKGATLSIWKTLRPDGYSFGATPLDSTGIGWEGDYWQYIVDIHTKFEQQIPIIFKGLSEDNEVIRQAKGFSPYDIVYIDGGHERRHIDNDLKFYAPMVKIGGYLVIDDACCEMSMPFGYFQGIMPVTEGVIEYMVHHSSEWEFITNVVHLRVYRRL